MEKDRNGFLATEEFYFSTKGIIIQIINLLNDSD